MDLEELAARLGMLEQSNAEKAAQERLNGFMGQFGQSFGGDQQIGMAILQQMDQRGIESAGAAANEAVQRILDEMRMEVENIKNNAQMLLDKITTELKEKVEAVEESVAAATGGLPGDGIPQLPEMPPAGVLPPPEAPMPPAGGPPPTDAPPPEAPMPPAGGSPPTDAPPPEAPGGPPPEELPPEAVPPVASDRRVKLLRKPATVTAAPKAVKQGWRPSSSMLEAIKGGI